MQKAQGTFKRYLLAPTVFVGGLLLIVGIVFGIKAQQMFGSGGQMSMPPASVSVFEVEQQSWSNELSAIGNVRSDKGITIFAEVPGTITSLYFNSGDEVEAGQLLLEQESGNEKALLEAAKAQLKLAEFNYLQVSELRASNTVSRNQFETALRQLDSAKADVENIQSSLDKKRIRARFAGKLGIRRVDLGEDLRSNTAIVDLYSQENLLVNFPIPQRWLAMIKAGQAISVNMVGDASKTSQGIITATDATVDETTRSIEVEATLDNSDGDLVPGMAVEVSIVLPQSNDYLVIPSTAVIYAPFGDSVFVVEEDDSGQLIARQQFIQIIAKRGDFVAVGVGLEAEQQVVSAGAFKLFTGQSVAITSKPQTSYSLDPKPSNS